jgi:hypothetical protein
MLSHVTNEDFFHHNHATTPVFGWITPPLAQNLCDRQ